MGYDHTMHLKAKVVAGTTVQQVAEAFKPIMEYAGYDGIDAFTKAETVAGDDEFFFDPKTGELAVSTYGEVGYGYYDLVCEMTANLGRIVAEPGEIWLYDHDTGDIDEAKTVIEFGPSEEAIKAYIARRDIEDGLGKIAPYVPAERLAVIRAMTQAPLRRFEVRPVVVNDDIGLVEPFVTLEEAEDYIESLREDMDDPERAVIMWGLYALDEDGCAEHLLDEPSGERMAETIRKLIGADVSIGREMVRFAA